MGSSIIRPLELIIDDDTPDEKLVTPDGMSTGYKGMFQSPEAGDGYSSLDPKWLVPRSEWQARCEEMEQTKTRLSDLIIQAGLKPKNQLQTNYCWIFAPTACIEVLRLVQGQKYVSLSPASGGAQIKNYRNVGGWGQEGLEWIAEHGLVPSEKWPDTAIDKKYATSENKQLALNYRADEWDRLKPKTIDEMMSCLFHRKPVAIGLDYLGHEMYAVDPMMIDGAPATRVRNSWGENSPGYPNGFAVLRGSKMVPDDAVCPRSVTAS